MNNNESYCPSCAATPGYDCIERGKVVLPHKARTESAESLQRAGDLLTACYLIDEALKDVGWDIALGDGRL
jgi:hypothetical protein